MPELNTQKKNIDFLSALCSPSASISLFTNRLNFFLCDHIHCGFIVVSSSTLDSVLDVSHTLNPRLRQNMTCNPSGTIYKNRPPPYKRRRVTFNLPTYPHTQGTQWGLTELIPTRPGIYQTDKAALTLANTLAYLDGDAGIPKSLLKRAGVPQRRWNLDGDPEEITPEKTGIAPELISILSGQLGSAIDHLYGQGSLAISLNPGGGDHDILRMGAGTRTMYKHTSDMNPCHWMLQALLIVCHAFPIDENLDAE